MKKQILVIHGGDTFETYEKYLEFLKNWQIDFARVRSNQKDWKATLNDQLGSDYEVILPAMPNKMNAKYLEWKIWFEKFIPFLDSKVILIGHSLGGTFLAKYLSENRLSKEISALFLISAPFDMAETDESLADFTLPASLNQLEDQVRKLYIYHSEDDRVVPISDFKKYQKHLKSASAKIFNDRGHFNQEELPELIKDIRGL